MSLALVPVRGDRPTVLWRDGVQISIAAHDAYALRAHTVRRHAMLDAHPDTGGRHATFLRRAGEYRRWVTGERRWYARHGLCPPWEPRRRHSRSEWRRIPVADRRAIVESLLRHARSVEATARLMGVSATTMLRWMRAYRVDRSIATRAQSARDGIDAAVTAAVVDETWNVSEVCRRTGLGRQAVRVRLHRARGVSSWRATYRQRQRQQLLDALRASRTVAEAGRRLGLSYTVMWKRCEAHGLKWREHVHPDRRAAFVA